MGRKEELLEAAERVFVKFGIEKTTLEDIASDLGLKKTAVYYYFKNKDDILAQMFTNRIDSIIDGLKDEVDKVSGLRNKIRAYMEYKITLITKHRKIIEMLDDDNFPRRVTDFMHGIKMKVVESDFCVLYEAIEKSINKDLVTVDKVDSLVLMIMGVTYGSLAGRFFHQADWDMTTMVDDTINIIFKGIEKN